MVNKLQRDNLRLRSFFKKKFRYEEDDIHSVLYWLPLYKLYIFLVFALIKLEGRAPCLKVLYSHSNLIVGVPSSVIGISWTKHVEPKYTRFYTDVRN